MLNNSKSQDNKKIRVKKQNQTLHKNGGQAYTFDKMVSNLIG